MQHWKTWSDIPGNESASREFQDILSSRHPVLYIGAGASAGSYPTWKDLLNRLADQVVVRGLVRKEVLESQLAEQASEQDRAELLKEKLAQYYHKSLRECLRPEPGRPRHTEMHRLLMGIKARGIVTTNYDDGLTHAALERRVPVREYVGSEVRHWTSVDVLDQHDEPLPILHAHGHLKDPESVVLTRSDYQRVYHQGHELGKATDTMFRHFRLIFVGTSLNDPWIDVLASNILHALPLQPRHVAIVGVDQAERQEWNEGDWEKYLIDRRRQYINKFRAEVLYYPVIRVGGAKSHSPLRITVLEASKPPTPAARWRSTAHESARNLMKGWNPALGGFRWMPQDTESEVQPWATTQAAVALMELGAIGESEAAGVLRFLDAQRRADGGWPHFARAGAPLMVEATAWAIVAQASALGLGAAGQSGVNCEAKAAKDVDHLVSLQCPEGGWAPVESRRGIDARTYPTTVAVWALGRAVSGMRGSVKPSWESSLRDGIAWLCSNHKPGRGWAVNPARDIAKPYLGLSAQVAWVLHETERTIPGLERFSRGIEEACRDVINTGIDTDRLISDNETADQSDMVFGCDLPEISHFLWFPWWLALTSAVSGDSRSDAELVQKSTEIGYHLRSRHDQFREHVLRTTLATYELAELTLGAALALNQGCHRRVDGVA